MDCDYCGLARGVVAQWEVTAGEWPGDGMTRYVCDDHLDAARGHVSHAGCPNVLETNRNYSPRTAV